MALPPCPACRGAQLLDVHGRCDRCRGEWVAPAHIEAAARGRLPFLRRFIARGPPTHRNCPADGAALKAFDVPGFQYEGDLLWGTETPRAPGTAVGEGCSHCGGVWFEPEQLDRAGGRKAAVDGLARLADALQ